MTSSLRTWAVVLAACSFAACGSDRPGKQQQRTGAVCGNGTVDTGETCDGSNNNGKTCQTEGFGGGTLACAADCKSFVTVACSNCGNGTIDTPEVCDGLNLNNKTCRTQGFNSGLLRCGTTCLAFDTTQCTGQAATCGNGNVETGEACDGSNLNSHTCRTEGFSGGTLSCNSTCLTFNTSACTNTTCGNNTAEASEACDGADLKGQTCRTQGFASGTLTCKTDCTGFVTTACTGTSPVCNNNTAEGSEACDGSDLRNKTCRDFGFTGGTLTCKTDCTDYVKTACTGTNPCGNATIDAGETCDTTNLNGKDCRALGFTGGNLTCAADCHSYVTSACTGTAPTCGNNTIDAGEVCDGTALASLTCASFGFASGTLACTTGATGCKRFNTAGCVPYTSTSCRNDGVNGLDVCDGANWPQGGGPACSDFGLGTTGNATCTTGCNPNFSACNPTDFCAAAGWYDEGTWCDPCDKLNGQVDSADCSSACVANGFCADYFLAGVWSCKSYGLIDPDCGQCGNNTVDGNELCDGAAFVTGGTTCADWGYASGTLTCRPNCTPDFTACTSPVCGDNKAEGNEECDGTDLRNATCAELGFAGGTLSCTACAFNTSQCTTGAANCCSATPGFPGCSNTNVQACVCNTVGDGYCCSTEWDSRCVTEAKGAPCNACAGGTCGNNTIEPGEVCDNANFAGRDCTDYGFSSGALTCNNCTSIETTACTSGNCCVATPGSAGCGDTAVRDCVCASDAYCCDAINGEWDSVCVDEVDSLGCGTCSACGDGVANGSEFCDGADVRGLTCADFGFASGDVGCYATCDRFDTFACTKGIPSSCGDGIVNGLDYCDGTAWPTGAGPDCVDFGLGAGQAGCNADCTPNFGPCTLDDYCTAHGLYGDGSCDPCDWLGGVPDDADCIATCADNTPDNCDNYYSVGIWTCESAGFFDDFDCGFCGDGQLDGLEYCEGTDFFTGLDTCAAFGYTAGTLGCGANCAPDFSGCTYQGDCCSATDGIPGCTDTPVETCVCNLDSYCCSNAWDAQCVQEATTDCSSCGSTGGTKGNCCEATPGVTGCELSAVETCVCAQDGFCCSSAWDSYCTREVAQFGCGLCGQQDNCCTATPDTASCTNNTVRSCVCTTVGDSYCCNTAWDNFCVDEAKAAPCNACNPTGGPEGNCCSATTGIGGCYNQSIENCVCAADATCCSIDWDSVCVAAVSACSASCTAAGNCCSVTPNNAGCTNTAKQDCVCNTDSYCCIVAWDDQCKAEVTSLGCGTCP